MAFRDDDVAAVRAATDLVAVISEHVGLKKVGRRWVGLCPFHGEKSPSFSVNAEQGLYYCFGCSARGDAISFVREIEHLDFVSAVEKLASRAGIPLEQTDEKASSDRKHRLKLTDAMTKAVDFYHERLLTHADAAPARSYLRNRGYTGETVRAFKIGWAPDDWDALAKALKVSTDILEDTGLGFTNRRGKQQDAFRARVMFPILDPSGNPVAFGGRILGLPSEGSPKYKNSPETKLYSKRRVLYGLNWAKDAAVRANELVVCEGYTDVIGFATSDVPQAVATCGTALAEDHVRLMKKYVNRVVLAYDADAAGQSAAERFYEWEQKFEIDLYVAQFPEGSDPGDLAKKDPSALPLAIKNAKPYLEFRLDRALGAADLRSPETRARAAERALTIVAEHPSALVRDQYVMTIADKLRLDPDKVREQLENTRRAVGTQGSRPSTRPGNNSFNREEPPPHSGDSFHAPDGPVRTVRSGQRQSEKPSGSRSAERTTIRLATQHPTEVAELLQQLAPVVASSVDDGVDGMNRLAEALFSEDLYLSAFRTLLGAETLSDGLDQAPPEVAELLNRVAVEDEPPATDAAVTDQVADGFALLFWTATQRATNQLRIKSSQTGQTFDLGEVKAAAELLLVSENRLISMKRLVPWILAMVEGE